MLKGTYVKVAVAVGITLLALVLFPGLAFAQPSISDVGAVPNPFSPNGDGIADSTTISYTVSEDAGVVVAVLSPIDGSLVKLLTAEGQTAGEHSVSWDGTDSTDTTVSDGTYIYAILATDGAGNTNSAYGNVALDTTSPALSVTSPTDGLLTNVSPIKVAGTTDGVSVTVNGTPVPLTDGSFSTTVSLTEGSNTITVIASDAAGNTTTVTRTVTLDTIAPDTTTFAVVADGTTVTNGATIATNTITLSGDAETGTTIEASVDGVLAGSTVATSPWSITITGLTSGAHTLTINATDPAGNTSTLTLTFSVSLPAPAAPPAPSAPPADTTPPAVWFASPGAGWSLTGTIGVIAGASDNIGVTKVDFYIDGVLVSSYSTAPYTYDWNTTTVADGTHTISAAAYDGAGNVAVAVISVVVANAGVTPAIAAVQPVTVAPAVAQKFYQVHVGAFKTLRSAKKLLARLLHRRIQGEIITQGGGRPYLVQAGLLSELSGAKALFKRLRKLGFKYARISEVFR